MGFSTTYGGQCALLHLLTKEILSLVFTQLWLLILIYKRRKVIFDFFQVLEH